VKNWIGQIVLGFCGLFVAWAAQAGSLEVGSEHELLKIAGQREEFLWLEAGDMLMLRVVGPTDVGLRLCVLLDESQLPLPVDLTVVKDDREQGTVRFLVPGAGKLTVKGMGSSACSEMVLLKIEVPKGRHGYRILASGNDKGVLIVPFSGKIGRGKYLEATPLQIGKEQEAEKETVKTPVARKKVLVLDVPPPDILAGVPAALIDDSALMGSTIFHRPRASSPTSRIAAQVAGMLGVGTVVLLVSGGVLHGMAEDENVQIGAGSLYDQSQGAYRASLVMGSMAATAGAVALISYYLLEEDR